MQNILPEQRLDILVEKGTTDRINSVLSLAAMLESPVQCDPVPPRPNHPTSVKFAPVRNATHENAPPPKRIFEFLRIPPVRF